MIEALLAIPLFLFLGQVVIGGCSCCNDNYCDFCSSTITTVQVQVTGITADADIGGCCTAMNATYVLSLQPTCCWAITGSSTGCETAACDACACSFDTSGCECRSNDNGTPVTYCDLAHACDTAVGEAFGTLVDGGNCDTCAGQGAAYSACHPATADDCAVVECTDTAICALTCSCDMSSGFVWPDPLPADAPSWAVIGEPYGLCSTDSAGCGFTGGCSSEHADVLLCLTSDGTDGTLRISGNAGGPFSGTNVFAGAYDTPIDCAGGDLDADATTFGDYSFTKPDSMCNAPDHINITIT